MPAVIPDIDIWRSAMVMVKRYGDGALLDRSQLLVWQAEAERHLRRAACALGMPMVWGE